MRHNLPSPMLMVNLALACGIAISCSNALELIQGGSSANVPIVSSSTPIPGSPVPPSSTLSTSPPPLPISPAAEVPPPVPANTATALTLLPNLNPIIIGSPPPAPLLKPPVLSVPPSSEELAIPPEMSLPAEMPLPTVLLPPATELLPSSVISPPVLQPPAKPLLPLPVPSPVDQTFATSASSVAPEVEVLISAAAPSEEWPSILSPPISQSANNTPAGQSYLPTGIIRVAGMTFVDDNCREYTFSGWNQWFDILNQAIEAIASTSGTRGPSTISDSNNALTERFQKANRAGMNVIRFFGFAGDNNLGPLQLKPGVYNETIFEAIDFVLAQAAQHNHKAIIALSSFWNDMGDGTKAYADWAGVNKDDFWDSVKARSLFTAHMAVVANRTNTFTGVQYKNDPTILAWNLMNEPRFPSNQSIPLADNVDASATVTRWYNYMASIMKSVDPNHMVTTGEEGFFKGGTQFTQYNPYTPTNSLPFWPQHTGQDAFEQHASSDIDFVAFHLWPDNWEKLDPDFWPLWLGGHIRVAAALGKPLVLEEFGKVASTAPQNISAVRDPLYKFIYETAQANLAMNGPLKGALFWEWVALGAKPSERGVQTTDSTWQLIVQNAAAVNKFAGRLVAPCNPRALLSAANSGPSTQLDVAAAGR